MKNISTNENFLMLRTFLLYIHINMFVHSTELSKHKCFSFPLYLLSQLQCIIVFMLQLNKLHFCSNPPIQSEQKSCFLQHRSDFELGPISLYLFAVQPLPHHFVYGTIRKLFKSLRRRELEIEIQCFYCITQFKVTIWLH